MIIWRNFRFYFRKTYVGVSVVLSLCVLIFVLFLTMGATVANRQTSDNNSSTQSPEVLSTAIMAEMASQDKQDSLAVDYYSTLAKQTKDPEFVKRAVSLALDDNQIELATKPAELWATLSPDSLEAQQTVTTLLLAQNNLISAAPYLEKSLLLSTKSATVSKFAESLSTAMNINPEQLNGLVQPLVTQYQNNPKMLFYLSIFSGQLGNLDLAKSSIQQVLQKMPSDPEVIGWNAQVNFKMGRKTEAFNDLKNALAKNNDPYLQLLYAEFLMRDNQLEEAKTLLESLSQAPKANPNVWLYLSQIARRKQDYQATAEYLKKWEQTADDPNMAREMLGELYATIKQPNDAITWFLKVTDGTCYFAANMKAADLMAKQGHASDAIQLLSRLSPTTYLEAKQLFLLQSEVMLQNNEAQNSLQTLNQALKLLPNDIQLLYFHALSAQQLEMYDLVESDLKQILSQDPNQVNALNILGFILTNHTNRYQEAFGYINKALTMDPENPSVLDSMGWIQYHLGNTDKALYYLQTAYGKSPVGEIGVHLAEVLWRSGDRKGAEDVFKQISAGIPNNPQLQDEIKRIKEATP